MGTNHVTIEICNSIEEAPNYNKIGGFIAANLEKAVIVKNGTSQGNPTVDLIFEDQEGKKYVALITGALIKSIAITVGSTGEGMN